MGGRALGAGAGEASQSLAGTAGEDRLGTGMGGGGACEERSEAPRWEERERGATQERGSFSEVPRFSSLLHQAAGDVVHAALACLLRPASLPPSLPHPPALLEVMHSTALGMMRLEEGVGWLAGSIVYFPQGGRHGVAARTRDLWGRLLQGEQQSTAVVG